MKSTLKIGHKVILPKVMNFKKKQWQHHVSVLKLSSVWRCEVRIATDFGEGGAEQPGWRDREERDCEA